MRVTGSILQKSVWILEEILKMHGKEEILKERNFKKDQPLLSSKHSSILETLTVNFN